MIRAPAGPRANGRTCRSTTRGLKMILADRGVGTKLLAEMEAVARRAGCNHLTLRASLNAKSF